MLSSLATSTATKPPPPPKDSNAKSLGSRPSSTVIARTAPMIFVVEIWVMPRASAGTDMPRLSAIGVRASLARLASRVSEPPRGVSLPR